MKFPLNKFLHLLGLLILASVCRTTRFDGLEVLDLEKIMLGITNVLELALRSNTKVGLL